MREMLNPRSSTLSTKSCGRQFILSCSLLVLLLSRTVSGTPSSPIPPAVAPSTVQLPSVVSQASVETGITSVLPIADRKADFGVDQLPINPRETLATSESGSYGSRYNPSVVPPPPPPTNYGPPQVSVQQEDSYGGNSYEGSSQNYAGQQQSNYQQPAQNYQAPQQQSAYGQQQSSYQAPAQQSNYQTTTQQTNYQAPTQQSSYQAPATQQSNYQQPAQQQSSYQAPSQQQPYNAPKEHNYGKGQQSQSYSSNSNYLPAPANQQQPQYSNAAAPVKLAQNSYPAAPVPPPSSSYGSSSPYSTGNNDNYGITESYNADEALYGSEEDDFTDAYSPGDIGSYETDSYSAPAAPAPPVKQPPQQSYSGSNTNYPPAPANQQSAYQGQNSYPQQSQGQYNQQQDNNNNYASSTSNYDAPVKGNNYGSGSNNNNYPPPAAQQPQQQQNYNSAPNSYSGGSSQGSSQSNQQQYQTTSYTIPLNYGGFTPISQYDRGQQQPQQSYAPQQQNQYPQQQHNQYPQQQNQYPQQQSYGQQQQPSYSAPQNQQNYAQQQQYPSQQSNYQQQPQQSYPKPIIAKPVVVTLVQSNKNDYPSAQIEPSYSSPAQTQAYPPAQQPNNSPPAQQQANYPPNNPPNNQQQSQHQYQHLPPNTHSGPALPLNSYASQAPNPAYSAPQGNTVKNYGPQQHQYQGSQGTSSGNEGPGYDVSSDDDSYDDGEYTPSGPAYPNGDLYSENPAAYRLPSSGPAYPYIPKASTATSYSNAGYGLDYSLGKPYGGRWLSKPYGRKFLRPRRPRPYTSYGDEALDLSIPLQYGPPPAPSTPAPYGTPSTLTAMPSALASYRNPTYLPTFGGYGLAGSVNVPSYAPALIPDYPEESPSLTPTYSLTPPKDYRGVGSKQAVKVETEKDVSSDDDSSESSFSYKSAASRLIPRIVKNPFKSLFKAFSSRKQKGWLLG